MQARDVVRLMFAAFALLLACIGHAAAEGKRIALVVGNGGYKSVTPLTNPPNVLWYRGGRDAWLAAGLPMDPIRAGPS